MARLKHEFYTGKTLEQMEADGSLAKFRANYMKLPETVKCAGGCGKILTVKDLPNHYKYHDKIHKARCNSCATRGVVARALARPQRRATS